MSDKKLYILTYDHGGYVLWKDRVKPRLKELFEWMEKYPKLRIGLDYESFTFDEFSKCDPEVVELAQKLIAKYPNRVGLGATTYAQPLALTVCEESNARQLSYAVRTNMHYFGTTPSVYAISEFALHNQTPQLIKLTGYKAAILRSHVMGYGYPRTFDSAWGNWIGRDGTAIPAVPTYDGEGRGFNCTTLDNWILSRWPQDTEISLEDFEKRFEKYEPLLASRYDDLTQDTKGVTERIEEKENCEYILLEDIPELYGEAVDELRTTDNDFAVQMPWGYCGNEIFNGCRRAETAVVEAERLNALSVMLGGAPLCSELDEAWQYALAAQHHDVTICGLLDLSRRFIPTSLKSSEYVKTESLKTLSQRLCVGGEANTLAINTHSFPVDEWIKTADGYTRVKLPAFTSATIDNDINNYSFTWNAYKNVLTTPNYRLKLGSSGIEYIDDINGRRIADNGAEAIFTAVVEDEPCKSSGTWSVDIDCAGATAVYTGKLGTVGVSLSMRFNGSSPRIDCKTQFEMHGERVGATGDTRGLKSDITVNGHYHETKLCFNLNLCLDKSRKMVRDLPYSISEWSGDIRALEDYWYERDKIVYNKQVSPEESFNGVTYLEGIYWLSMRDDKNGFAVMNRGCMGGAVRGNKLSLPLLYSNEYMCGTRILEGTFDDEFALLPFDAKRTDADIHRAAVSYNYPPVLTEAKSAEINFKAMDFDADGEVILTALYPENGDILARFCNFSDSEAAAVIKCTAGDVTEETNLLGEKTADIADGKLSFRAWEIKTVRIKLK